MTTGNLRRRIDALQRAETGAADLPAYVSVARIEDLEELTLPGPVKVYIGVSPDDWPAWGENEEGQHTDPVDRPISPPGAADL